METTQHFAIRGTHPRSVERPTTPAAVAEILACAQAEGLAVAPVGGGGALHLGNPIERYDVALDMRGLDRVLEHQATDLVLSVEGGARLGDVSEVLARHGQWLPIEAPHPAEATIGGLIATALSGPGRATHGSLRDSLIGIAVAGPDGTIAKAGGMVVKNVSGFDLMRLHHGALGTLGVIVSANFKVLPKHRGEATVLVEVEGIASALAVVEEGGKLVERPSAVVVEASAGTQLTIALRYDGRPSQVVAAAEVAASSLGRSAVAHLEEESRDWWRRAIDHLAKPDDETIEMRLGSAPGDTAALATSVVSSMAQHDISIRSLVIWPQVGSVVVRWRVSADDLGIAAMVDVADEVGATWRIVHAPIGVAHGRDIWGRPPAALDTIRRLKAEFDPSRTLNPGRFCGHI